MDNHRDHDHDHFRGHQHDNDDHYDVDDNRRSAACRRYPHRCGRCGKHLLSGPSVQTSPDDRENSNERWSTDEVQVRSRGHVDGGDMARPNKILLVHGLDRLPVNCDRVFNLFCLYGNVTKVKVLRDDKVLVEMEDGPAAERCVSNLHLMPLDDAGDWRLKVKYSKLSFIYDQVVFNKLLDDTPAQKDYSKSKLNRFPRMSTRLDLKSRINNPSKILHFFNAPIDVCGFAVHKAVTDALGVADAIRSITILPKRPEAKCSTGLIELKTIALAAKTVLLSNHTPLESKRSRFPFLTKLCFSKWSEILQVTEPTAAAAATSSLRLSCVPRSPWQLHESERTAATTALQIARVDAVTGCCGDCPWTLWTVRHDETPRPPHEQSSASHDGDSEDDDRRVDRVTPVAVPSAGLMDMLRHRLCGGDLGRDRNVGDDRGDPSAAMANDVVVHTCSGGPLGDV